MALGSIYFVLDVTVSVSRLTTDIADIAAITAGSLQAIGYVLYIRLSLTEDVNPNPLTWLMFSYGTALLALIEFGAGATWRELLLPFTCACGSLVVAGFCAARGRLRFPQSTLEFGAFGADIALTVGYVGFWLARPAVAPDTNVDAIAAAGFLICSNATTLTAFIPILASARARPEEERGSPWVIWSLAYSALLVSTLAHIRGYENAALLIYPLTNVLLHGVVALLALTGAWAAKERAMADLLVAPTQRTGRGLFARRAFARGELVFTMSGKHRRYAIRTEEESKRYENWLQIGEDLHLIPDRPYVYANHSCEPNLGIRSVSEFVALRDIAAGEELTYDYAITTDEPTWHMACACGKASCRWMISGIQTLSPEVYARYLPFINPYFQLAYGKRTRASVREENQVQKFVAAEQRLHAENSPVSHDGSQSG